MESARTRHTGLRVGGAALFAGLVLAYGVFAWHEAETHALAAAEAEGRALLRAVAVGVESSVAASRAVESLLAEPLVAGAHDVAEHLVAAPGLEENVLRSAVGARGLAGAALLDPELGVVASADAAAEDATPGAAEPFAARRIARLDLEAVVARFRADGLISRDTLVVGFEESPFAARTEFAVAVRAEALPGFVVLRADATRLEQFREAAGITRVLRETTSAPGIAFLAVEADDGTCLASGDPGLVGATLPQTPSSPTWCDAASGRRTLDIAVPVAWEGGPAGRLRVGLDAGPVEAIVFRTRRNVVVFTAAALSAGLAGLVALAAVERRRRAAEARLRDQLAERERFAAMGRVAAGVAHEIRGPLNALSLSTQLLARETGATSQVSGHVAAVRAAVARVDAAVADFLALGQYARGAEIGATDIAEVVADAHGAEGGSLRIDAPPEPVVADVDRALLARAIGNLVRNARQAAPPESVHVAWRCEGREVVLDVDDGGPGVPPALRASAFDPFVTTRANGTGLGLAIAKDAVERQGGRIEILDVPGGGARFRIRLPVTRVDAARAGPAVGAVAAGPRA